MIQINDMFRLQHWTSRLHGYSLWWLEEWQPTPRSIQGRWLAVTDRMHTDAMDQLLERMQCPAKAHAAFREAAGIKGTSQHLNNAGDAERGIPLETTPL